MNHAIEALHVSLETARYNEPILRAEGRIEEADACKERAEEIQDAITCLWVEHHHRQLQGYQLLRERYRKEMMDQIAVTA